MKTAGRKYHVENAKEKCLFLLAKAGIGLGGDLIVQMMMAQSIFERELKAHFIVPACQIIFFF